VPDPALGGLEVVPEPDPDLHGLVAAPQRLVVAAEQLLDALPDLLAQLGL
jgi:hypothetical protein